MPYWNPLIIDGQELSLDHLEPLDLDCVTNDRTLSIKATYSNHCFSVAFDPEVHQRDQILQEELRPRVFDQARYDLSSNLPVLLPNIVSGRVQQTPEKNYYYRHVQAPGADPYDVFFNLKLNHKERRPPLLLLHVESAYINTKPVNVRRRPRTIRFSVLAQKIAAGQRVDFNWR